MYSASYVSAPELIRRFPGPPPEHVSEEPDRHSLDVSKVLARDVGLELAGAGLLARRRFPDAITDFAHAVWGEPEPDTLLATMLFTDIVGSTAKTAELGDHTWRNLIERYHAVVRAQLDRYRGREFDTAGDGFFATFAGPIRAIQCAVAARAAVRELGLEIRAGLHTGECELIGEKRAALP